MTRFISPDERNFAWPKSEARGRGLPGFHNEDDNLPRDEHGFPIYCRTDRPCGSCQVWARYTRREPPM